MELWPSLRGMIEEDILKGEVQSVLQDRNLGTLGTLGDWGEIANYKVEWKMLKNAERC